MRFHASHARQLVSLSEVPYYNFSYQWPSRARVNGVPKTQRRQFGSNKKCQGMSSILQHEQWFSPTWFMDQRSLNHEIITVENLFKKIHKISQRCQWCCWVWLCNVNDTTKLDSVVSMSPQIFCTSEYLHEIKTKFENTLACDFWISGPADGAESWKNSSKKSCNAFSFSFVLSTF